MAIEQNLYKVFKLPATKLIANGLNIQNYTIQQGIIDENVVSIGDNQVFQQLRYIHGDERPPSEIHQKVSHLMSLVSQYKKAGEYRDAQVQQEEIDKILFVKDIINVEVNGKKSDFKKFAVKGFYVNGQHYVYFCSGAGQIRRNTATFIDARYEKQVKKNLNCGFDEKTDSYILAKYTAYFALSFSSILWVRDPKVCIIPDYENTLKDQSVNFVVRDSEGRDGKTHMEHRIMDITLNCFDGQGLIDPNFAILWGQDMGLDYTPCSFVVRAPFVKGNLVQFDFKEYGREHGIPTITDIYGITYNLDDIDVLISESQFKAHKFYRNWQEYLDYFKRGRLKWGVARYNKKKDEEYVLANYQYIQALTLSKEDVHELVAPTVKWINEICSGKTLPTILYMLGARDEDASYQTMYNSAQNTAMKAVVKNPIFLEDSYVQQKIYKNISSSIDRAKLGKIWIRGNYQFCIADPLAQCQRALGLEPVGSLKANQVWCKFWEDRLPKDGDHIIDICRSPMISQHEHNPSEVVMGNEEADRWYSHIYSGCIFSIYDTATARMEDSDFDGDIVCVTDNKYFIKGSHKEQPIITYEKGLAKPAKMTIQNITNTVIKGFGSGVGGFSNAATCLYAMAGIYKDSDCRHKMILDRIDLEREIVGQEIDRIKGAAKPYLPTEWKKFQKIDPNDSEEVKKEKYLKNSIVISKKPYFFRYLYPDLNQLYKQFESTYNDVSRDQFGIKLKKLIAIPPEKRTEEQNVFIKRYEKYNPLITSDCTMNRLCREFENCDFNIRFSRGPDDKRYKQKSMLPTYEPLFADSFSEERLNYVASLYKTYNARKYLKMANNFLQKALFIDYSPEDTTKMKFYEEYKYVRAQAFASMYDDLRISLQDHNMSGEEFLFYCNRLSKRYSNFNWGFAWNILEDQIIRLIPYGHSLCPVRSNDANAMEYLGEKYILKDVSRSKEMAIDNLITSILGRYDGMPDLDAADEEPQGEDKNGEKE